jgi:2,3-dimethylmalate lyase
MEGKQVIDVREMIAKIKAAVDTRMDPDFMIMARTDALEPHGLDEAITRANQYRESGADMIFVEAPRTEDQMRRITREVNAPAMANNVEGGKSPLLAAEHLQALGYSVVAFPTSAVYAVSHTLTGLMRELLRSGTSAVFQDRMLMFEEFNALVGLPAIRELEERYLPAV